ncbi:MAG: 3-deoxy-D-manno-octulosonate 8-phosphate phosphatase (KDO 8-P phosphatase) [Alphaproteobacteria bacterium]|jgi:3-deoxy-D-manno-octulosonate 8-phosphate phosphatase (KDO 8-P phosphatase)
MTNKDLTVQTLYQTVSNDLFEKCKQIKLVVFDVDGVFSDGQIYLGNNNEELKAFNTKDGYGVKALSKCGISVAVITGRKSVIVEQRMHSLNVKHLLQGREDKSRSLAELMQLTGFQSHQIASVGDDMPDLGMFDLSAIKVAVQDAHPLVKRQANYITTIGGGKGAVREVCDLFLQANDVLTTIHGASV